MKVDIGKLLVHYYIIKYSVFCALPQSVQCQATNSKLHLCTYINLSPNTSDQDTNKKRMQCYAFTVLLKWQEVEGIAGHGSKEANFVLRSSLQSTMLPSYLAI